jgi:hypothetical protein
MVTPGSAFSESDGLLGSGGCAMAPKIRQRFAAQPLGFPAGDWRLHDKAGYSLRYVGPNIMPIMLSLYLCDAQRLAVDRPRTSVTLNVT